MQLTAQDVSFSYGTHRVLDNLGFCVDAGALLGVLGANGAGKSTLLRVLSGVVRPSKGLVRWGEADLHRLKQRTRARMVAMMEQSTAVPQGLSVRDVVSMGRRSHRSPWGGASSVDRAAVARAMETCSLSALDRRQVNTLSGGEFRRVLLAMVLAQEAPLLLLDEPFAHLDLAHVVALVRTLTGLDRTGRLVVVAAHDINAVFHLSTRCLLLTNGRPEMFPSADAAASSASLRTAFGADLMIDRREDGIWVLPRFGDEGDDG